MSKSYQLEREREYSDNSNEHRSDTIQHVIQKAKTTGTAKEKPKRVLCINVNTGADGRIFSHTRDRSRTAYKHNDMNGLQEMMQDVEQQRSSEKMQNKDRIKHGKSNSKSKSKTTREASPRTTVACRFKC